MSYREYRKLVERVEYETVHGADDVRQRAAGTHLPAIAEAVKQLSEDRTSYANDYWDARSAWREPHRSGEEPHVDHNKAARRRFWLGGAVVMFLIESTFAAWLATTYLVAEIFSGAAWLHVLMLAAIGILLTLAASVLAYKAVAPLDDDKRPEPSLQKLTRVAAVSGLVGLLAIGAFLLTRQYAIGGPILQLALAVLTLCLAAGVGASMECAEVLARVNRLAVRYDHADKLHGRARILEQRLSALVRGLSADPGDESD